MSNSIIFSGKFILAHQIEYRRDNLSPSVASTFSIKNSRRRRFGGMIRSAKNGKPDKRTWWQKFFFENDDWFGLKDDMLDDKEVFDGGVEEELSEDEKFKAWTMRAEVIMELREAQEDKLNVEGREWEDWLQDDSGNATASKKGQGWEDGLDEDGADTSSDPSKLFPEKDVVGSVRELFLGNDEEDEIIYEDRVFRYASGASAKFLAILVIIPWALDFVVHDYILMPFLDRYVKTVPLAAELLDVRKTQKLDMIKTLKIEKARYRFETEIGKSPPLSDDELWWELRHKAYHSESGWQTLIEIIFEHYGLEVDPAAITVFVSFVPVVIDACVKLWLFKFLPRFSPNVANIFREMRRH